MRFPLEVRYTDYDARGHVNNAVYLTYFEVARWKAWIEGLGESRDVGFVIAEATVRYASPALLGERLEIEILTSEVRTKAWVWRYTISAALEGRLVAEGSTVQVMYDYATRRSIAIPPDLRSKLHGV